MLGFIQTEKIVASQKVFDLIGAAQVVAIGAPDANDNAGAVGHHFKIFVVAWPHANRVSRFHHVGGVCGPVCEQVGHIKPTIAPVARKRHTAANCWVVGVFGRG